MGGLEVDRFATATNALLPVYNTYFFEEGTSGVDAFAQTDWCNKKNFCNPPFSQIARVVKFLRGHHPTLPPTVLIAPKWRQQAWY